MNKRRGRVKQIFFGLLGLFYAITAFAAQPATAAVGDYYTEKIHEFNVEIDVQETGTIHVTESILYDFGTEDRHGIFRDIPVRGYNGVDYIPQDITIESVTDENGIPYIYVDEGGLDVHLKIGDPDNTITGQHWYVISYFVTTEIYGYADYDELYWNSTGTSWEVPILSATTTVTIPEGSVMEENLAVCFTGTYTSDASDCMATVLSDRTYSFSATDLPAFSGLTVVANFNKGIVTDPFRLTSVQDHQVYASIQEDRSVYVEEWIRYQFGTGAYTDFSHTYSSALSRDEYTIPAYTIHYVTDEDGVPYIYVPPTSLYNPTISIAQENISTHQEWIVVSYTIAHAVDNLEHRDELYFNPLGSPWNLVVENVGVTVWLPEGAETVSERASCTLITQSGYETYCSSSYEGDGTYYYSSSYLSPYDTILITADFDKGIIAPSAKLEVNTTPYNAEIYITETNTIHYSDETLRLDEGTYTIEVDSERYFPQTTSITVEAGKKEVHTVDLKKRPFWVFIEIYLPIILTLVGGYGLMFFWYKKGKDPKGTGIIISQYEPPKDMSPAELGVVVDGKAHMHDITATIIHLAIRGYIRIEQTTKEGKKAKASHYIFHEKKDFREDQLLKGYESEILHGMFPSTSTKQTKLSELQNKFYTHLPAIKKDLYKRVVSEGFYPTNPVRTRGAYIVLGSAMIFAVLFTATLAAEWVRSDWYQWLNLLGLLAFVLGFIMPKRTKKGVLALEYIKGLKLYLTVAEKERIKFHQSPKAYREHFEEMLPYAIALEVEEEWAAHFEDMFKGSDAPDWYNYSNASHMFNMSEFGSALSSMSSVAGASMSSSPSSSGSGGGGFSGGGGGGGGGGSW